MTKCKKHNIPFGFYCGYWGCRICLKEKDKNTIEVDTTIGKAINKND
jgi:hypothetical protein